MFRTKLLDIKRANESLLDDVISLEAQMLEYEDQLTRLQATPVDARMEELQVHTLYPLRVWTPATPFVMKSLINSR